MSANPTTLDELAIRHGVDKSSLVHNYVRVYERHLGLWRHELISLLEIGIGDGASLRMWRDYFSFAKIYGLDVKECRVAGEGIRTFQGHQADEDVLERMLGVTGELAVIIDDGSHFWADQIASFKKLFPHVTPDGYYVVEDLHTSYWDAYKSGDQSMLSFLRGLVDDLNLHGRSGYGKLLSDPEYFSLRLGLNVYERMIESITFYKSIAFVQKKRAAEIETVGKRQVGPASRRGGRG
jgi:hypothetical protein